MHAMFAAVAAAVDMTCVMDAIFDNVAVAIVAVAMIAVAWGFVTDVVVDAGVVTIEVLFSALCAASSSSVLDWFC